jgi:tRNA-2-methylthio-N6-dimethylallyladenosine synthase
MKKKYYIITFGCQMNKSDSERMASVFEKSGYAPASSESEADIIVVNSCSVRQAAIDRIWGLASKYEILKEGKNFKTMLTGCVLESDKSRLREKFDFVFNIKELVELERYLSRNISDEYDSYFKVRPKYSNSLQALIPIMSGCNNYCSYCAVPYVRGAEESRSIFEILKEAKDFVLSGGKEIMLLGQNVNSYCPNDLEICDSKNPFSQPFAKLLWELNQLEDLRKIHFTSAHPKDMHDDVINALGLPRMANYLHLALQSGDDDILRKMNRKYTAEKYARIIEKVRKVRPDIAVGTDIIVGFPGETIEQFQNTLNFYEMIQFDIAFLAMYSPRVGTAAAAMEDDVTRIEKKRRWHALQDLMEKITFAKNQKYVGKTVEVLIDKVTPDFCEGNSSEMKRVRFFAKSEEKIVKVKVLKAMEWLLEGEAQ